MRRIKVPSDGTILATPLSVEQISDEGREFVEVVIAPAAGLVLPDSVLTDWTVEVAPVEQTLLTSPEQRNHPNDTQLDGSFADHANTPQEIALHVLSQRGAFIRFAPSAFAALARWIGRPMRFRRRVAPIDAARLGLHLVTKTPLDEPLPPIEIRLSTTRGTNALLEGRGARVGVLVSDGLTGLVEIGDQTREHLFARVPTRTRQVAHGVQDLPERSLAEGTIDLAASSDAQHGAAKALHAQGCERIVVSLAHALTNEREREVTATLQERGIPAIAARDIAPHPRLLTRTETACVHARIEPVLFNFVDDATQSVVTEVSKTFIFTSAGVLQPSNRFLARDTLYSGPAGGARSVAVIAERHGLRQAVGFDMGGTSSDVSRVEGGEVAQRTESRLAGMTVAAPSVAVESVAAGGGSICRVRDGILEVGPASAGANPGPACYGRGGPLTVTDVNLLAGRMATGAGAMSLDRHRAELALTALSQERGIHPTETIDALLDIANARMALAIETLCVRDGVDPKGHALIAFGGAGGQHACAIADRLHLDRIVFPQFAGFLCAEGVFAATPARFVTRTILKPLDDVSDLLASVVQNAQEEARRALQHDGFTDHVTSTASALLRLMGQESTIPVPCATPEAMRESFVAQFRKLFGYEPPARQIEVVSIEVCMRAQPAAKTESQPSSLNAQTSKPAVGAGANPEARMLPMRSEGELVQARVLHRSAIPMGEIVQGPALITDAGETVIIDRSWQARMHASGDLIAERVTPQTARTSQAEQELFAARIESIAIAMGNVLERTALSPNIRDRLDFSCAILDRDGTLVQNAPHLPVHLGALGICTRLVAQALPLAEDDIAVTNHPAFGGSHLPDVTTVAPVFVDGERVAYVAVRAHHAEIGGTRPGSFPPDARSLAEEGVVLAPFLAVSRGIFDREGVRARFATGPNPSRNPEENIADLEAQIAATRYGIEHVAALARELGASFVQRCENELARADFALRRAISTMDFATRTATRTLDDGSPISVSLQRRDTSGVPSLAISFEGSAAVHPANFNAPLAVTRAATLYALRLFIDEPIPMNEGLLRSVQLDLPTGMLHPPFVADPSCCPPVVAGNVETSQSVVAALLAVLGLAAESQSTMNNVLFGNDRFTVYETLGGGAGAGPTCDGASAVHVHMSNTRLTDIDVLERRAHVVVRRFMRRQNSGGRGIRCGGDGIVRAYEFREPITLSFFGSRRTFAPQGMEGGAPGACGDQYLARADGERVRTKSTFSIHCAPGDRFTVETPGGGGFGA
ncbi:MAG: hypothetical protein RL591_48 [Planctomycetota bacterium]